MKTPAQIIWKQIPTMTKMACGVREARQVEEGQALTFKVGGLPMRYITVRLDPTDTYTVEYFRIKRGSMKRVELEKAEGVYADMLGEVLYHQVNK